jgi:vacuolar-type H+-ATPase subunit E/Vma4
MEEPSDAMLSQLMKEAAEEAKRSNEEATNRFFEKMREDAQKISTTW